MPRGLAFLLLLLALPCSIALADGKIFPRGIAAPPPIPDQQAIIAWDASSSTQTLAIETRFAAFPAASESMDSSDSAYAWVVPLPGPAAPEVSAATPGLFPTVRAIFQPRVFDNGPGSLGVLLFLTVMLLLAAWVASRANGSKLSSLVSILLVLLGLTCFAGLLLPSLGTARSAAGGPTPGVSVLSRSIVGSYEVAVVGADSAAGVSADSALAAWFKANGFDLSAAAAPVLADYAARSWVFAAVKLRPDAALGGEAYLTPHPLVFRFKTPAPVYPMRLTGVGNGPLTLDLYIFGHSRASVPGLAEIRCDECEHGDSVLGPSRWFRAGIVGIGHPMLKDIVRSLPVATKLSGTLPPAMQLADMPVSWSGYERSGEVVWSERSARWRAIEAGCAVIPAVVVLLVIIGALRKLDGRFVFRNLGWALGPAVVVGIATWMSIPTVEIREGGSGGVRHRQRDYDDLPELVGDALSSSERAPTIAEARAIARSIAEKQGLSAVEEDSPEHYTIQAGEEPGTIEMVLRNWCGAPQTVSVWPQAGRRR